MRPRVLTISLDHRRDPPTDCWNAIGPEDLLFAFDLDTCHEHPLGLAGHSFDCPIVDHLNRGSRDRGLHR
jgi:hypothetical protein